MRHSVVYHLGEKLDPGRGLVYGYRAVWNQKPLRDKKLVKQVTVSIVIESAMKQLRVSSVILTLLLQVTPSQVVEANSGLCTLHITSLPGRPGMSLERVIERIVVEVAHCDDRYVVSSLLPNSLVPI